MVLLVKQVITSGNLCFLVFVSAFKLWNYFVGRKVLICRFVRSSGDDERRSGVVDEDRVDFVDDRKVVIRLD